MSMVENEGGVGEVGCTDLGGEDVDSPPKHN